MRFRHDSDRRRGPGLGFEAKPRSRGVRSPTELSDSSGTAHGPGDSGHPLHAERQADVPAGDQLLRGPGCARGVRPPRPRRPAAPRLQLAARLGDLGRVRPGRLGGGRRGPAARAVPRQAQVARGRVRPPRAGRRRDAHARQTRGEWGAIPNLEAHRRAVETLVAALKEHRNWYLDLANERDVRDARYVPAERAQGTPRAGPAARPAAAGHGLVRGPRPRRGGPARGAADDRPRFRRPPSAAGCRLGRPDRGQDPRVPRDDAEDDRPVGTGALPGAVPPGLRPLAADGERLPHRPARRRGRRGRRVVPPQRLQPRQPGGASATLVRSSRPTVVRPVGQGRTNRRQRSVARGETAGH